MNITDIYTCSPGARILAACAPKAQENMIDMVCSAMPASFKTRTALNSGTTFSMDIVPDEDTNRFSDLHTLCTKLVNAAGRKSHFEGLLLLNVSEFSDSKRDAIKLRALGEFLAIPNGLASKCITLFYGPDKESEVLHYADCLDFDGKLQVIRYEYANKCPLPELLTRLSLHCASSETESILNSVLKEMSGYDNFNPEKFLRMCGNECRIITKQQTERVLNDPYSYLNRTKKTSPVQDKPRIGFVAAR